MAVVEGSAAGDGCVLGRCVGERRAFLARRRGARCWDVTGRSTPRLCAKNGLGETAAPLRAYGDCIVGGRPHRARFRR